MYINRSTARYLLFSVFLFLLAGILNLVNARVDVHFWLGSVSFLLFLTICIVYLIFAWHDFPYRKVRTCLMAMGILLILFLILELTIHVSGREFMEMPYRFIWYLYYVPTTFIPNCYLMAVIYNLRYEKDKPPAWYSVSYVISGVLSLIVLTNDWHGLVFRLYEQSAVDESYAYGPMYYVTMAWMFLQFLAGCVIMYRSAQITYIKKYRLLIFIPLIVVVLYFIWYATGRSIIPWLGDMYDLVEVWIGLLLLQVEFSAHFGLLRSNVNYHELFEASGLSASLYDSKRRRYHTATARKFSKEQRDQALQAPVDIDANHRLTGHAIRAGSIFWVEDLSHIRAITRELSEGNQQLTQENELLRAENAIQIRRIKADEENRLLQLLSRRVQPRADRIEAILRSTDPYDPVRFRQDLAHACPQKVYIKRLSNMVLLAQEQPLLPVTELRLALEESLEYLKLLRVKGTIFQLNGARVPAGWLTALFEAWQEIADALCADAEEGRAAAGNPAEDHPLEVHLRLRVAEIEEDSKTPFDGKHHIAVVLRVETKMAQPFGRQTQALADRLLSSGGKVRVMVNENRSRIRMQIGGAV